MSKPTPGPYWSYSFPNAVVDTITIAGSTVTGIDQTVTAPASSSKVPSSSAVDSRFVSEADRLSWKTAVTSIYDNTAGLPLAVYGDRYIALVTAHGWIAKFIYEYTASGWRADSPVDGDAVYIDALANIYIYHLSAWLPLSDNDGIRSVVDLRFIPGIPVPASGSYISNTTSAPYIQDHIYTYDSGWVDAYNGAPPIGLVVYVQATGTSIFYNGSMWLPYGNTITHDSISGVPIGSLSHSTINSRLGQDVSSTASPTFSTVNAGTLAATTGNITTVASTTVGATTVNGTTTNAVTVNATTYKSNVATAYLSSSSATSTATIGITVSTAALRTLIVAASARTNAAPSSVTMNFLGRQFTSNVSQLYDFSATLHLHLFILQERDLIGVNPGSYNAVISYNGTAISNASVLAAIYTDTCQFSPTFPTVLSYDAGSNSLTVSYTSAQIQDHVVSVCQVHSATGPMTTTWTNRVSSTGLTQQVMIADKVAASSTESVTWGTGSSTTGLGAITFALRRYCP